ncbi:MAG: hypothetical protein QOJ15_10407 [Bradyrhizobium sp.]|nr:hypothetical protein [Bradyrhizobium sp.]
MIQFTIGIKKLRRALGTALSEMNDLGHGQHAWLDGIAGTWVDVDKVEEVGEYAFRDGVIIIKRKHLDVWKRSPDATFTLVRFVPASALPKYGLVTGINN